MKTKVKIISNPKNEQQHQMNVFNWALLNRERCPELALMYHIPNGGNRNAVTGRTLKEQGVKPGVPDIHLPVAKGNYHSLYIELKVDDGTVSKDQDWWIDNLNASGNLAIARYGWEAAVELIGWYLSL